MSERIAPEVRLKVLVVHSQQNSRDGGGSFRILSSFLRDFDRKRFEVKFVLSILDGSTDRSGSSTLGRIIDYGIKVHQLRVPMNQASINPFLQLKYICGTLRSTWSLYRLIRLEDIDVVYTNSLNIISSGLAGRLAGVWNIYHVHEIVRRPVIVARALARVVGKLADKLICVSEAAEQPFLEVGIKPDKLVHVPNCIDLDIFSSSLSGERVRKEFSNGQDVKLIVSVGRLIPKKGHHCVVRAAEMVIREYPSARFLIVGHSKRAKDSYERELSDEISRLGLDKQVLLTGMRDDVPEIMAGADVAILAATSETTPESFGLVLLEAMAMGTPVVASRLGGIPEVVEDGKNGFLVPPRDSKALAKAILSLLRDDKSASEAGRYGQSIVRDRFDAADYSKKIETVLLQARRRQRVPI